MMGKLNVWRSDHKRDGADKMRVGGLVSIEDLEPKAKIPSPSRSVRKKAPRLSLGRRSFSLRPAQPEDDPLINRAPPVAQDVSLFSNIPASATFPNGTAIARPPSSSGFLKPTPPPQRPSTTDPESGLGRRRSKTAPAHPAHPPPPLPWSDKPLPLTIDFDHTRKRAASSQAGTPVDEKAAFGASLARPRTTEPNMGQRQRSETAPIRAPAATYSLTPSIQRTVSRGPSINSRGPRSRSNSITSIGGSRQRSNSQRSEHAPVMPPSVPPSPGPKMEKDSISVLDDVEGTLSATITELQELQTPWHNQAQFAAPKAQTNGTRNTPEPPKSAPANQAYFAPRFSMQQVSTGVRNTPDSSHSQPSTPMVTVTPRAESPSYGRLQSVQAAYDQQKRKMQVISAENDTLKQQISLARTRLEEMDALRAEKDKLEKSLQDVQSNINAALDLVRTSRNNEQAAQNKATHLTARLEEANMQKVDVLENHQELEQKMRRMENEIAALRQDNVTLRQRPEQSVLDEAEITARKAEESNKHLTAQVDTGEGRSDLPTVVADLAFKLEDMQQTLQQKDAHIQSLLQQSALQENGAEELAHYRFNLFEKTKTLESLQQSYNNLANEREASINNVRELERRTSEQEHAARAAQAERDQYRQLLYAEFRRAANEVHNRQHPATGLLDRKVNLDVAINEVRSKAQTFITQQNGKENFAPEKRTEELEQEISYHVKDIVLYKLDVKGYKKDLKKAQARIQQLQQQYHFSDISGSPSSQRSSQRSNSQRTGSRHDTRPSISSQSSTSTVPQLTMTTTLDDHHTPTTPGGTSNGLSVQTYTPSGSPLASPAGTPRKERGGRAFFG